MTLYPLREAKISQMRRLYREVPAIACKGLCFDACGVITMTSLEHHRLANALGHDPEEDAKTLACPLLKDGRCGKHDLRPLICRLYGVAEGMRCQHGCYAESVLTDEEASKLIQRSLTIGGELRCTHTKAKELLELLAQPKGREAFALLHPELLQDLLKKEAADAVTRGVQAAVPGKAASVPGGRLGGPQRSAVSPGTPDGPAHA
jgi:uncharacterized protein